MELSNNMALPAMILASHGYFAQEALKSAEMIIGHTQSNVAIISVTPDKDYDTCLAEIQQVYTTLDKAAGCLIITDIYGGTPANIATYVAIEHDDVCVFSGLNLPLLLELLLDNQATLTEVESKIENIHVDTLVNITKKLKGAKEDGNQVDSY